MSKKNTSKKMLKASVVSLVLCVVMLIGTTFAWFTDSVTNSGNKIEAGTLDVSLQKWNSEKNAYEEVGKPALFDYAKWEPGYTDVKALKIVNNGSLALKYQVDFISATSDANGEKLANAIDVYYKKGANAETEGMPKDLTDFQRAGTLSEFLNKKEGAATGELPETNNAAYLMVALHMPETVGNEVQGVKTSKFDIVVKATQLNKETDGFGNPDYDKDAEFAWDGVSKEEIIPNKEGIYEVASPANLAWLSDEINHGTTKFGDKTIKLTKDINFNGEKWEPLVFNGDDAGVTIDGKGHTIKNFQVRNSADYGGGFIKEATSAITIKDLKFDNVTVATVNPSSHTSVANVVGIVMGYAYGTTTFENVEVTNSSVTGFGKIGVMLGMGADPGVKITFRNCVSKDNTIRAVYNAGGLAGLIQRGNGIDNTVIENCTVEGNTFAKNSSKATYVDLSDQQATFKNNDIASGTDVVRTVNGKYWDNSGYYWGAYANYYVSYGSSSYDAPITTEGEHQGEVLANSEICVNDVSEIPDNN